jgi:hypothetical protein
VDIATGRLDRGVGQSFHRVVRVGQQSRSLGYGNDSRQNGPFGSNLL